MEQSKPENQKLKWAQSGRNNLGVKLVKEGYMQDCECAKHTNVQSLAAIKPVECWLCLKWAFMEWFTVIYSFWLGLCLYFILEKQ